MSERDATESSADWPRLIEAIAQRGDKAAFAKLFAYYAPRIKTYLRRSGTDEASAEELAQEALLAVWRKAALFDPATTGASAWVFTIARNLRIDSVRRQARRASSAKSDDEAERIADEAPHPDSAIAASQVKARVKDALGALSEEQLRVVELSFYQDLAHAEIAETLGIPLGTVKSRLRLAMAKLRAALGDIL